MILPPLRRTLGACALAVAALAPAAARAQRHITSPKEAFGFNVGDDYRLANYTQFEKYWRQLATESDRAKLVEIGKTEEGRPQLMMIISSPANLAKLDRYKEISRRLALGLVKDSSEARALAREGKSVVWIDGGLHATEVLGAHQLIETAYQLLSRNDAETLRFLDDCIILTAHANPDGMELVSNWYMKDADSTKRNMNIPRLYEKYAGHDDNRDFYMSNTKESQNVNHVFYWDWFPQIVYNHHQTGPAGTVMFAPPFRDPFNYNFDPLIPVELDLVAASMHSRFEAEGKPGVTMRSGSTYSTWWNGGLRTTVYFHNMIGLLTEAIGNPTPQTIPFIVEQQLPRADLPYPIEPQVWHFRQSIDYSITANWAVLDIASRQKENLLFNFWKMGNNSVQRGSRDTWTTTPSELDSARKLAEAANPRRAAGGPVGDALGGGNRLSDDMFRKLLRDPAKRDPRGYVIPSDQPDFPTAVRFINALRHTGITVLQSPTPFTVRGKQYAANSFVIKSAQPFRPHVMDMFEPQDHPNDFAYPGGPPKRPYDNAGYTPAIQMGVVFDRILEGFDVPSAKEIEGLATVPAAKVAVTNGAGYLVSHAMNNAFIAVNRALKGGADVYMLKSATKANGKTYPAGTFWIASNRSTTTMMQDLARTQGVAYEATPAKPAGDAQKLHQMRVGLIDQYGGSMPSGWTRYIFEQYDFPYSVVYAKELDAGNLNAKYDVLVFPSGTVPGVEGGRRGGGGGGGGGGFGGAMDTTTIPAEFRATLGRISADKTVPQIRSFIENGGTVVAVGTSINLGYHLGLPMENALVENGQPLPAEKFYIPGSILRSAVDTTQAISYGVGTGGQIDIFYDNSPAFRLTADAKAKGVTPLAWFGTKTPLRSGWAWGQAYLDGAVNSAQAKMGKGTLYLFGPEITFRAQPYGTFKWLFNGIYTAPGASTAM